MDNNEKIGFYNLQNQPDESFFSKHGKKIFIGAIILLAALGASFLFFSIDEMIGTELEFKAVVCFQSNEINFIRVTAKNNLDTPINLRNSLSMKIDNVDVQKFLKEELKASQQDTIITYNCSVGCSGGLHSINAEYESNMESFSVNCPSIGNGNGNGNQSMLRYAVDIIRDDRGIAHVYGDSDLDAFFGLGYATAEDRLFQINKNRMIMKGRFAELIGDRTGQLNAIIENDKAMRRMGFKEHMEEVYANLDSETKSILQAYSEGVNHYIETNEGNLMYLFSQLNIHPEPWTPVDSLLAWSYMVYPSVTSREIDDLRKFEDLIRNISDSEVPQGMTKTEYAVSLAAEPFILDLDAPVVKESDLSQSYLQSLNNYASQNPVFAAEFLPYNGAHTASNPDFNKMSHGWVVGGSKSTTGNSMLLGSPLIQMNSPSLWYEYHIVGDTFDIRGIGMPGSPTFFIGYSKDIAFTQTSGQGQVDQSDIIKLKTVGDKYEVDGVLHDYETRTEEIKIKNGASQFITVKKTIFGPVITEQVDALPGEEYVIKSIPLYGNSHTVQSTLPVMRARNVYELSEGLEKYRYPPVNTIMADSSGNIAYRLSGTVPLRSPNVPLSGLIAIDGSSLQNDWQSVIPPELMPQITNPSRGVLFSANHLSYGYWYPIYLGNGISGDSGRSWRIRQLLEESAPQLISPDYVLNMRFEKINIIQLSAAKAAIRIGRDPEIGPRLSQDERNALLYLNRWVAEEGGESILSSNYQAIGNSLNANFRPADIILRETYGYPGGRIPFYKNVTRKLELNPDIPAGEILEDYEIDFIRHTIERAWATTISQYGSDPEMWKENFFEDNANVNVEYQEIFYNNFGSLDEAYDKTYQMDVVNMGTLFSQPEQVYIQFVDFANPDSSRTISPMGTSENPQSQFFRSQDSRWVSEGQLYQAPLTRDLIQNTATSMERIEIFLSPL